MKITQRERYAVTAMFDLALWQRDDAPVSLASIVERRAIPTDYLYQLLNKLVQQGLVQGVRGPGGGYRLAVPPDRISVGQIVTAVGERLDATRCAGRGDCQSGATCLTHHLWEEINRKMHAFLDGISLTNLIEQVRGSKRNVGGEGNDSGDVTGPLIAAILT